MAFDSPEYDLDCDIDQSQVSGSKFTVKNQPKQSQRDQREREYQKNQRAWGASGSYMSFSGRSNNSQGVVQ